MAEVVGGLFDGLGCDAGEPIVAGCSETGPDEGVIGVHEQRTHHRAGEISVRLLAENEVRELAFVPQERQVVLGAPVALEVRRVLVAGAGDAEMVEGEVAEGDVLLEVGSPRDPLAEPLGEYEVVVPASNQECREPVGRLRCRHMCPTSSGMS